MLPRFFNRTRPIPMRIRGSKTPPLNSSSAPTPSPSPPSNSPSSNSSSSRCQGLDLLVLAVIHVNGHGALDAEKNAGNGVEEEEDRIKKVEEEKGSEDEVDANLKRRRRQLAVPSRYQDFVLQPWKRQTRQAPRDRGLGSGRTNCSKKGNSMEGMGREWEQRRSSKVESLSLEFSLGLASFD